MSKQSVVIVQSKLFDALEDFTFDTETSLDDKFEVLANLFVEQAIHAMSTMSAKDAMIGAGIAIDKMQLLRGLPTEIKACIPILIQIGQRAADGNVQLGAILAKVLQAMDE